MVPSKVQRPQLHPVWQTGLQRFPFAPSSQNDVTGGAGHIRSAGLQQVPSGWQVNPSGHFMSVVQWSRPLVMSGL